MLDDEKLTSGIIHVLECVEGSGDAGQFGCKLRFAGLIVALCNGAEKQRVGSQRRGGEQFLDSFVQSGVGWLCVLIAQLGAIWSSTDIVTSGCPGLVLTMNLVGRLPAIFLSPTT